MAHGGQHELLQAGGRAPDVALNRLDGGQTTLREILTHGPALLAFYKVNCPVCQMTFPFLERIHQTRGLAVYGVSQNGEEDTLSFNRHFGLTLPSLLDAEADGFPASNAFGISTVPTLFLVEPDGSIGKVSEGWRKSDIAQLGLRAGADPFRPTDSVPEAKAG